MRSAQDLIVEELKKDRELRLVHLDEAVDSLMNGDLSTGLLMIRNLVNATCGFVELSKIVDKDPKSLMRMLSANGNPKVENLFAIINFLLDREGFHIVVTNEIDKKVA